MALERMSPFEGTAEYYARFRPGIPAEVISYLQSRFDLDGAGRCLDLGCGTGQLTYRLVPYFERVVGLDPDPEMLAQAQTIGTAALVSPEKLELWNRPAESLDSADGKFRLVTICRAFVWMDQYKILDLLKNNLSPGGGVAIIGDGSFWSGKQAWQKAIKATVQQFLGESRRAGNTVYVDSGEPYTDMLAKSSYSDVTRIDLPLTRLWSFEEVLGCLYSTSFAAKRLFGERLPDFEKALFDALGRPDPVERLTEETEFTVQSGLWLP